MMTTEELKTYKAKIVKEYGICQILHATKDIKKKNCVKTGNREAPDNASWIDYWRAMTEKHSKTMYCSSCGKELFVGEPSLNQFVKFNQGTDTIDKHRAHGGHIWVVASDEAKYTGGRYITPLCPECNGQHDKDITIKKGSVYCKELGAKTEKS